VARNRKRAKERRARRPQPSVATTRGERSSPDPIAHATPDSELAEAQMALGRPELTDEPPGEPEPDISDDLEEDVDGADELELAEGGDGAAIVPSGRAEGELERPPRRGPGNRLVNFLQGSWRELQRVQWPDRRQVIQATGVVIGFVIVAGVYLGVADWVAGKIVSFIIK
jgi:preprotein translocase subunit SecE